MSAKYIGKYVTFRFTGRKFDIIGVVLKYNKDYTLIRNFTDYTPNGFYIFKNEKIEFMVGAHEKVATKILKAKKYSIQKEPHIPLGTLDEMLTFINYKYKIFELDNKKGDACDVVSYLGQKDNLYCFDELTPSGKWRYKLKLPERECRFISFDTNYLNSLKLIAKF